MDEKQSIVIRNLTKSFGTNLVLDQISLTIEKDGIYGLLGRNGAGKTTLLNLISNRLFPTDGEIYIDGMVAAENDEAQGRVYMMSEQELYPEIYTVKRIFQATSYFYSFDMEYAKELCERFELNPKKKLNELSTGYRSIYKVIIALCVGADYIFLDEPVLGLDANHRDLFYRCLLEAYAKRPRTFVISTHLIEEVSNVVEHVFIIKKGKLIRNESCESLLTSGYTVAGPIKLVDEFIKGKEVLGETVLGGLKTVSILGTLNKKEEQVGLEIGKMDLQKLFIELTNH